MEYRVLAVVDVVYCNPQSSGRGAECVGIFLWVW